MYDLYVTGEHRNFDRYYENIELREVNRLMATFLDLGINKFISFQIIKKEGK